MAWLTVAVSLAALWAVGPAQAATVGLENGVLAYGANRGERNSVDVHIVASGGATTMEITDGGVPLTAGAGCLPAVIDMYGRSLVRCPLAPGAPLARLQIPLGDRNDSASVAGELHGVVEGGAGDDSLDVDGDVLPRGATGNDQLTGANLYGGPGSDDLSRSYLRGTAVLRGGPGADRLEGGFHRTVFYPGRGRDDIAGGLGADIIHARDRSTDWIYCNYGRDLAELDGHDFYDSNDCNRVRRRGQAHAVVLRGTVYPEGDEDTPGSYLVFEFGCPYDWPRVCSGTLIVRDRRHELHREHLRLPSWRGAVPAWIRLAKRPLIRLARWARLTVVSRDRRGDRHVETLTGALPIVIPEPDGD